MSHILIQERRGLNYFDYPEVGPTMGEQKRRKGKQVRSNSDQFLPGMLDGSQVENPSWLGPHCPQPTI